MAPFADLVELAAKVLEGAGVLVILGGAALVVVVTTVALKKTRDWRRWYEDLRRQTGRTVLLGLELLVGADIIRTVAAEPTLKSVAVLGGIVLIRTFLSFTLELELDGRWPWQAAGGD